MSFQTRSFALIILFSCAFWAADSLAAPPRPNIIIILCDDMGFSDIGCYGSEISTPNLDHLASNGLRFTQVYNTARCCPSRTALLTGLYPHQAGVGHMTENRELEGYAGDLNTHCVTIAQVMHGAGYATFATGKWHVTRFINPDGPKHNWPVQRGFDHYYGTLAGAGSFFDPVRLMKDNIAISAFADPDYRPKEYYYTEAISEHACRFIADHSQASPRQPFFMYVAFTAAHWPMQAKEEDIAKYKGKYDGGYEPIRLARFEREKQLSLIDPKWDLSPQWGKWEKVKDKQWEARCMEVYAAMIDNMDRGVGRIVQTLQKTGHLDDTLILFLQDNGGNLETVGRQGTARRADHPTLPPMAAEALQTDMIPKQTRNGYPVLQGTGVLPGPADTFIAYGKAWGNVSNTPFREYKHFVHEGGISTPLIAHWPAGIHRHNELEGQPGHIIDLMATCVDLAGAQYPAQFNGNDIHPMEGRSLAPTFEGKPIQRDQPLFWEHEGNRAIRIGNFKLVAKHPTGRWELYDMTSDRTEMHDLATAQPARLKEMVARWEAFARRTHALPWPWKPPYGEKIGSSELSFDLKQGDDLPLAKAPLISGRGVSITAIVSKPGEGVIVAHGGTKVGYSIYIKNNQLCFAARNDGAQSIIRVADPVPSGRFEIAADISKTGEMMLKIDGKLVASGESDAAFSEMPNDGLQVGRDAGAAVGDYKSPFVFRGTIDEVKIRLSE